MASELLHEALLARSCGVAEMEAEGEEGKGGDALSWVHFLE